MEIPQARLVTVKSSVFSNEESSIHAKAGLITVDSTSLRGEEISEPRLISVRPSDEPLDESTAGSIGKSNKLRNAKFVSFDLDAESITNVIEEEVLENDTDNAAAASTVTSPNSMMRNVNHHNMKLEQFKSLRTSSTLQSRSTELAGDDGSCSLGPTSESSLYRAEVAQILDWFKNTFSHISEEQERVTLKNMKQVACECEVMC